MEPWREELYHHGILGQKWGVRRYQRKDGSWTPAGKIKNEKAQEKFDRKHGGGNNKSEYFKKQGSALSTGAKKFSKTYVRDVKKSKGIRGHYSAIIGDKARSNTNDKLSSTYSKLSKNSKTKIGKTIFDSSSYNTKQYSKYYDMRSKESAGKAIVHRVIDPKVWTMSQKSIVGRKTTLGKEAVVGVLTLGVGNVVLDAKYLHDQKKTKK